MSLEGFIFGLIFLLMSGVGCNETEVVVEAGSQAVLPCKCDINLSLPAAITWKDKTHTVWKKQSNGLQYWGSNWLQNGIQRVQCPHSEFVRGDYSLQINSVRKEDGGVYTCRVQAGGRVFENRVMLRVIHVSVSPSAPVWGDSVSVTCGVTPWPEGAYVKWMLNKSPFVLQTGSIFNKRGSVVKDKATEKLTGNWTCIVNSKKQWQASATLSVGGIIQPPKDDTKLYAAVGSSFSLPCVFSSGLIPTDTAFERTDGKILSPSNISLSPSPSDKSLSVQEVTFEEEGKYRCTGTILGRRLSRTMQLVVAKIVQTSKKGSVELTCQLSDPSEVTQYEWIHVTYDLNGTKSEGPFLEGQTVSLKENWGEWTCRYSGKGGILGNVTTQVQLMGGLSGQKSAISRNYGTVIGLSFLLTILLLILAQMFKNHQRRKRIFQYPALETIVHTVSNEQEERERNRVKE